MEVVLLDESTAEVISATSSVRQLLVQAWRRVLESNPPLHCSILNNLACVLGSLLNPADPSRLVELIDGAGSTMDHLGGIVVKHITSYWFPPCSGFRCGITRTLGLEFESARNAISESLERSFNFAIEHMASPFNSPFNLKEDEPESAHAGVQLSACEKILWSKGKSVLSIASRIHKKSVKNAVVSSPQAGVLKFNVSPEHTVNSTETNSSRAATLAK
ncbi:hypothetical protein C8J57DRAFT_1238848 [Mycena rebaudengoi]|nr:hypothetical protein C8J57DRAFT_1238848 [Mycena rebaudengoi]